MSYRVCTMLKKIILFTTGVVCVSFLVSNFMFESSSDLDQKPLFSVTREILEATNQHPRAKPQAADIPGVNGQFTSINFVSELECVVFFVFVCHLPLQKVQKLNEIKNTKMQDQTKFSVYFTNFLNEILIKRKICQSLRYCAFAHL